VFISAVVASSTAPVAVRDAARYVLVALDISLFVRVSVVALPTSVSVALGRVIVCEVVSDDARVVITPIEFQLTWNRIRFVSSVASQTLTSPVPFPTR